MQLGNAHMISTPQGSATLAEAVTRLDDARRQVALAEQHEEAMDTTVRARGGLEYASVALTERLMRAHERVVNAWLYERRCERALAVALAATLNGEQT